MLKESSLFKSASDMFNSGGFKDSETNSLSGRPEETPSMASKLMFWKNNGIIDSINDRAANMQETAQNYQVGLLMMAGAGLILALSFLYLPLFPVMPQKFCALFSIGSLMTMFSLSIMMGHKNFFKKLLSRDLIAYSVAYIISLTLGIYYSCIDKSYFIAIIMVFAQVISLSYLVLSNVPYGKTTLNLVYRTIFGGFKWIFNACLKKTDKPYLPL